VYPGYLSSSARDSGGVSRSIKFRPVRFYPRWLVESEAQKRQAGLKGESRGQRGITGYMTGVIYVEHRKSTSQA
jgi:hypothetical protein